MTAQNARNELFFQSQENKDAAQRIADTVTLHLVAARDLMDECVGKWCAFALRDGKSDGDLYDTKDDAIRLQKGSAKDYCYLRITPDGIRPSDAWSFLKVNRHPMIDTTAPEHVIGPVIYPRFSNLTREQKRTLKRRAEHEAREAQNGRRP